MTNFRRALPGGAAARAGLAALLMALLAAIAGCGGTQPARLSAASAGGHVSARDRGWMNQAHQADLAEIEVGELAQDKGGSAAIRAAGAMLVSDHSAFDTKLVRAAAALKTELPDYLTEDQAVAGHRLGTETGIRFDHDFVATMMTGHQQLIAATQAELSDGSSPMVTGLAREALPTLQKHLRMLQAGAGTG